MRWVSGPEPGQDEPAPVDPQADLVFRVFTWTVYLVVTAVAVAGVAWLYRLVF